MRLKFTLQPPSATTHTELVAALGWSAENTLYSCSDDQSIRAWNMDGEPMQELVRLDTYVTDVHWQRAGSARSGTQKEVFLVACTDGSFKMVNCAGGKIEKSVDKAHKGAVTAVRFSYEGTSICSAGEDGHLKIWSRAGMLRSVLMQTGQCIYSISWSPSSDAVLYATGKEITIKPVQPQSKQIRWKAHEGTVMKVDWNPVNSLIVSGGEDCRYRVWDAYGRPLYTSAPGDSIVTSVSWSPSGELFAVGAFNNVRLCDKTGWSHSLHPTATGSVFNISWTNDGTIMAGAGGNGTVCFGHLTDRQFEWQSVAGSLGIDNIIRVKDINSEGMQDLSFRDKVVKVSVGFDHLIVATTNQVKIFDTNTWAEPIANDLKDMVTLLSQCEKFFLTVDNFSGIQLFNYEGRIVCTPQVPGLKAAYLNEEIVSLCNDFLVIVDQTDKRTIHVLDANTGKALQAIPVAGQRAAALKHSADILEIQVSQAPSAPHLRKIAVIDKNHDLWVSYVRKPRFVKLGSMVSNCLWNDEADMLAAICDGDLAVWIYPQAVFFDPVLTQRTREVRAGHVHDFGNNPRIASFFGKTCTVRRTDGARIVTGVSPYPLMLYSSTLKGDWENAVRLCRFVKDQTLWSSLACMALDFDELNTAEVACAAIHEVDKLQYIVTVKEIPAPEIQRSQLMLLKRHHRDAESVLLQGGFVYRAIKTNIKAFKWERALQLAVKYQRHIDTVMGYRQRHLQKFDKEENLDAFKKQAHVEIIWDAIKQNTQNEKRKEAGMSS